MIHLILFILEIIVVLNNKTSLAETGFSGDNGIRTHDPLHAMQVL